MRGGFFHQQCITLHNIYLSEKTKDLPSLGFSTQCRKINYFGIQRWIQSSAFLIAMVKLDFIILILMHKNVVRTFRLVNCDGQVCIKRI